MVDEAVKKLDREQWENLRVELCINKLLREQLKSITTKALAEKFEVPFNVVENLRVRGGAANHPNLTREDVELLKDLLSESEFLRGLFNKRFRWCDIAKKYGIKQRYFSDLTSGYKKRDIAQALERARNQFIKETNGEAG